MCGIAGIIGSNSQESVLDAMLKTQHHRGPDYTGKYVGKDVALGHNRLSIIDLSEEANQPFYSPDKRYILVFNGEIYNYLELRTILETKHNFITQSDTEVLLAAYVTWGEELLSKLNGMFSFTIWDQETATLFAARDRFGVKPLYYVKNDNRFLFASEIKALFAADVPKEPNEKVWASYFAYGSYGLPNETFWEDVQQLPGGHSLLLKDGNLDVQRWYNFEEAVKKQQADLTYDEVKITYKKLLEDSIKLRFRADVPVGFNVSGGLDSSALLGLVNTIDRGKNINAYTFYTGDDRYDELPWVKALIANTKNPLHKVLLKGDDVPDLSIEMAFFQDEPYGGVPTIAYGEIFKEARKAGVLVLLDGQGMDEQWAGYDYYTKNNNAVIQGVKKSPFKTAVLDKEFLAKAEKPEYPKPFDSDLLNMQYRDLFYTKIPRALRFNDRISMAASTELREPFLDYRLVEFAFAQPKHYKIRKGVQKYLLRDLVSSYIPNEISFAPKRPLQTPQREWLGDELRDWVNAQIKLLKNNSWFDQDELERELQNYFKGDRDSSFHIWQWLSLSFNDHTFCTFEK